MAGGARHPFATTYTARMETLRLERAADAAQGRPRVRVLRLERRRRGRHARARSSCASSWPRSSSASSTPTSSTTSRKCGRSSRSARTTRGAWPGRRTPSPRRSLPSGNDIAVMIGIEPQNRWKHYSRSIVEVARESGAELVVTLGGFLADTPHTRPVPVTGSADGDLADQLGLAPSSYEGPTGIVGVVHDACKEAGMQFGEPVGGGPALHRAVAQPQGGARAALAARGAARHEPRHDLALPGGRLVRARRLPRGREGREDQPLRTRAREPRRRARRGRRRRGVPAAAGERRGHRGADRALSRGA